MTALFVVVPLALVVSAVAVVAFVWSVRHGQMDDLSTPALRMLDDDDDKAPGSEPK
jgi:cbb3-type cytochrome oxidase maturation protein